MELERRLLRDNALAVASGLMALHRHGCSADEWHRLSRYCIPTSTLPTVLCLIHSRDSMQIIKLCCCLTFLNC